MGNVFSTTPAASPFAPQDDRFVDHNTGGADALRVTAPDGSGLGGVLIRLYLKSEYDAAADAAKVRGQTKTKADGRWRGPVFRDPSLAYVLVFADAGFGVGVTELPAAGGS